MVQTAPVEVGTPSRLRRYLPLIKSPQTALLVATGVAGYLTARCPVLSVPLLLGLTASLLLAVSGSTVLNMWWDRDIDVRMCRTQARPSASGALAPGSVLRLGLLLSLLGVGLALLLDPLYGLLIFGGLFFDVVVYSIWLKRRTAWSIVWGGISGAMPILAGRTLGIGAVDPVGVLLGLGILFWIPTHIMTFNIRYAVDYAAAGVPTFVSTYGVRFTRGAIAVSSVLATAVMLVAGWRIGIEWQVWRLLGVLSLGLVGLALGLLLRPSDRVNRALFKYASVYMLSSMTLMAI